MHSEFLPKRTNRQKPQWNELSKAFRDRALDIRGVTVSKGTWRGARSQEKEAILKKHWINTELGKQSNPCRGTPYQHPDRNPHSRWAETPKVECFPPKDKTHPVINKGGYSFFFLLTILQTPHHNQTSPNCCISLPWQWHWQHKADHDDNALRPKSPHLCHQTYPVSLYH